MAAKVKRFETVTVKVRGRTREKMIQEGLKLAQQFFGRGFKLEVHSMRIEAAQSVPKTGQILEYKGVMTIGPKDEAEDTSEEGYDEDD